MRRVQIIENMTRIKNYEVNEAECPDDTPPDDMEEGVREKKDDKNEKNDEEKKVACPDDTPSDDMEEGVSEKKDDKNERIDE